MAKCESKIIAPSTNRKNLVKISFDVDFDTFKKRIIDRLKSTFPAVEYCSKVRTAQGLQLLESNNCQRVTNTRKLGLVQNWNCSNVTTTRVSQLFERFKFSEVKQNNKINKSHDD